MENTRVRRPLTAYNLFFREQRASFVAGCKERGPKRFCAMGKELARRWKTLSEAEKAPYRELAEKDRVRYRKEKQAFQEMIHKEAAQRRSAELLQTEKQEQEQQVQADNPSVLELLLQEQRRLQLAQSLAKLQLERAVRARASTMRMTEKLLVPHIGHGHTGFPIDPSNQSREMSTTWANISSRPSVAYPTTHAHLGGSSGATISNDSTVQATLTKTHLLSLLQHLRR